MSVFLRKYNTLTVTGTTAIRIPMIKRGVVDFAVGADWTPAAGDVKIAIDGAAPTNVTNLPTATASGNTAYWEFILTAAELTSKSSVVTIADAATKAVEDQAFIVETFGNASAMYQADVSAANLPANVTQLLGTAWLTPGTAGTPDVNAKLLGGTAQTGRDVGASVLLAAGQKVDVDTIKTNPVVNAGTVTFPTGATLASTTNITAGTITTATNLTNAPTAGDFTAAMKTSLNAATPASVTGAVGSVTARVTANADQINGDATAAATLASSLNTVATGTCAALGTTTSVISSALSPSGAVADQFKGRVLIFADNTTTAALQGQAVSITASSNAATPTFTVTALTTAPVNGDTFIIV